MDADKYISDGAKPLKASAIREMFKLMARPEIISLAGGSPSPDLFPSEELSKIAGKILMTSAKTALAYGTTDGYAPFKEDVRNMVKKADSLKDSDAVIITTGAQQGIDLAAKILLNKGDKVVVENPSFIGTLNSLRSYQAELLGVPVESDGMDIDALEKALSKNDVKLIYTIPTFQNPSGATMSLEKRRRLLELANKYDVIVIEDNPYGDLRFAGENVPTIKSMDTEGRVIYVGSFSKILSPGMRLGFVVGEPAFLDRIEVVKQVNDVHTPVFTQMIAHEFMKKYDMNRHIEKSRKLYGQKAEFMCSMIDKYFPEKVTYIKPEGGIFIWCTAPDYVNTDEVHKECINHNVAIVPGSNFSIDITKPTNSFRLNYSTMPDEKIEQGIIAVAGVLKQFIK